MQSYLSFCPGNIGAPIKSEGVMRNYIGYVVSGIAFFESHRNQIDELSPRISPWKVESTQIIIGLES